MLSVEYSILLYCERCGIDLCGDDARLCKILNLVELLVVVEVLELLYHVSPHTRSSPAYNSPLSVFPWQDKLSACVD